MRNYSADDILDAFSGYNEAVRPGARGIKLGLVDPEYRHEDFQKGILPKIIFDAESEPSDKRYPVIGGYWPHGGDRVVLMPAGTSGYVIIGSVESGTQFAGLHTQKLWAGNIATGFETMPASSFTGDSSGTTHGGKFAQLQVSYGPLHGDGPTRMLATVNAESTRHLILYTYEVTSSSAGFLMHDVTTSTGMFDRHFHWMAIRGFG